MSESPVQEEFTPTEDMAPASTKTDNDVNPGDCTVLYIEKLPMYWNLEKICAFIREITTTEEITDNISFIIIVKSKEANGMYSRSGSFLVKFTGPYFCRLAYSEWLPILESKQMKLSYDLDDLYVRKLYFKKPFIKSPPKEFYPPQKRQKLSHNTHNTQNTNGPKDGNENETYGLSIQYLKSLNIKLPLVSKVFVSNLNPEITEKKIHEVFSYAGMVVDVHSFKNENYVPPKHSAKISFDHPVEAVQAVAMFNNQKLYSWPMTVKMYNKPINNLPDGLFGIGPGLGVNGQPLRGVRSYLEIQEIKKMLTRENNTKDTGGSNPNSQNISPFVQQDGTTNTMFNQMANTSRSVQAPTGLQTDNTMFNQMANTGMGIQATMQPDNSMYTMATQMPVAPVPVPVPVPVQAPNQQSMNAFGQSSMMNPFNMPGFQMLQNLSQQNSASVQQALSMLLQNKMNSNTMGQSSDQGDNSTTQWGAQPNMATSYQNDYKSEFTENKNNSNDNDQNFDYGQRNFSDSSRYDDGDRRDSRSKSSRDEDKSNKDKSDMLIFKNLPRSVTLQALKNKMQEVGEVRFAEMTGQGRAIVRFLNSKDADRCIKLFNKSKVDGQTIDVRYF